jgi:hypothetical protein
MPQVGLTPIFPAFERVKTVHALDLASTVIDYTSHIHIILLLLLLTQYTRYTEIKSVCSWLTTKCVNAGKFFAMITGNCDTTYSCRICLHIYRELQISYPCNRPWRPIGLWDVEVPTFSRQSAHRWRRGCQPYAPAGLPLPPRKIPGTHFC